MEVPAVPYQDLIARPAGEASAAVRARVAAARRRQQARVVDGEEAPVNAALPPGALARRCPLDPAGTELLARATARLGLSARAYHRVLRVARTIADLAGAPDITAPHLAEAIQYRALDRPVE